jgi:hypothetical protein
VITFVSSGAAETNGLDGAGVLGTGLPHGGVLYLMFHINYFLYFILIHKQEVLGRTNCLLSFVTTGTA